MSIVDVVLTGTSRPLQYEVRDNSIPGMMIYTCTSLLFLGQDYTTKLKLNSYCYLLACAIITQVPQVH